MWKIRLGDGLSMGNRIELCEAAEGNLIFLRVISRLPSQEKEGEEEEGEG